MLSCNEYVNRTLVTDGDFLYNCAYKKIPNSDKIDIFDVILIGTFIQKESVILPDYLNGHKIKYASLKPYKKGKMFPTDIDDFAVIPTLINKAVSVYNIKEYCYADDKYFTASEDYHILNYVISEHTRLIDNAFINDKTVESICFDTSSSYIPPHCFAYCTSLNKVRLSSDLKCISSYAFFKCKSLKNIILPNGLTKIAEKAFADSGLEYIIIPGSIKSVNKEVFKNCNNLQTAVLGTNTEKIYSKAFADCVNLNAVFIPPKTKQISKSAFDNCNNLIIYSTKNSFAEKYALNNGIPFIPINKK